MSEYILGSSDHELGRLELQQDVWAENTADFLDRLEIEPGWDAIDMGCGPGFVVQMLRERVGEAGSVIGLDESEKWIGFLDGKIEREGWRNVRTERGRIQELPFERESADVIFLRWVLGFLPEREALVERLAKVLRPGGVLAVMDYNHEGVSVFPPSPGFRAAVQGVRDYYELQGGDTWVIGDIARLFSQARLQPFVFQPYVIGGGPDSPAFRWADAFFPFHTTGMVEAGVMSEDDRTRFLAEWGERKLDPHTLFFSPIVAGAAARK